MICRIRPALAAALSVAAPAAPPTPRGGAWTRSVEKGHVLACAGAEGSIRVAVGLHENPVLGTHVQLSLRTAKTVRGRSAWRAAPFSPSPRGSAAPPAA